jgi:3-hydroxy acid dehydrogenase/malonic semialdehyde reductase
MTALQEGGNAGGPVMDDHFGYNFTIPCSTSSSWTSTMIVFITGASAGFGAAMARTFVKNGHQVVLAARRKERLDSLARELGESALPVAMDVTSKASIEEALSMLPQSWRQIDVLINNAGLALNTKPAHEVPLEDWDTMIDTNVKGLVTMTHALLPSMVERGSGLVINLGSVAGHYPYPGGNVYGATKAFVEQFTLNLRADLVGTGVRATNLAPGLCGGTEFSNVRFKGDDAAASKVYEGTQPLTAEDIAATAYWIATLPPHININSIEMMPTCQGFSPFTIKRG